MNLIKKINNRSARIGVIGLGYVGLPLAIEFVKAGYNVVGIDLDESKIKSINSGKNYINDVNNTTLEESVLKKTLVATNDFSSVTNLDAISICVPTPLNKEKNPDISHIVSVMAEIKKYIHPNMIITLESTTYPGSTKELILPYLNNNDLFIGENIYLCFSPERIDPGNKSFNTNNTPKVIGGITKECSTIGSLLYASIIKEIIVVGSTETAEMVKLLENTFRAVNIGLANEVAIMCEKLGVNAWEVIDAAGTKPFGFMKFYPGPGLGGHCIPIDPHYLAWKLKTLDYDAKFIKLAGEINTSMPNHIIKLIIQSLNSIKKTINGCKVLILGVAYKKNINDIRESPALDIIELLKELNASIDYHDPHVNQLKLKEESLNSVALNRKRLSKYDISVIITDHDKVDYDLVLDESNLILDTRNVYAKNDTDKIVRLGHKNLK
jgi:UDP-N-acetyl-D-glucosamine dehydrogenase